MRVGLLDLSAWATVAVAIVSVASPITSVLASPGAFGAERGFEFAAAAEGGSAVARDGSVRLAGGALAVGSTVRMVHEATVTNTLPAPQRLQVGVAADMGQATVAAVPCERPVTPATGDYAARAPRDAFELAPGECLLLSVTYVAPNLPGDARIRLFVVPAGY